MTEKNFDPWCGELADHFLPDETQDLRDKLAQHIQDSVEAWLDALDAETGKTEGTK